MRTGLILAGFLGLTAVLAGTFGAHALADRVSPDLLPIWETAASYHVYHALALLALAAAGPRLGRAGRIATWCFFAGSLIFAGTLYALVLTGQRWLGAVTPVGGTVLIVGWISVIVAGLRLPRQRGDATSP